MDSPFFSAMSRSVSRMGFLPFKTASRPCMRSCFPWLCMLERGSSSPWGCGERGPPSSPSCSPRLSSTCGIFSCRPPWLRGSPGSPDSSTASLAGGLRMKFSPRTAWPWPGGKKRGWRRFTPSISRLTADGFSGSSVHGGGDSVGAAVRHTRPVRHRPMECYRRKRCNVHSRGVARHTPRTALFTRKQKDQK